MVTPKPRGTFYRAGKYVQAAAQAAEKPHTGGFSIFRHPEFLSRRTQTHKNRVRAALPDFLHNGSILLKIPIVRTGDPQSRIPRSQPLRRNLRYTGFAPNR